MKKFDYQAEKEREREREKQQNEAALSSGFDHGFGSLATYNGYEAGEKLPENYASHSAPA